MCSVRALTDRRPAQSVTLIGVDQQTILLGEVSVLVLVLLFGAWSSRNRSRIVLHCIGSSQ